MTPTAVWRSRLVARAASIGTVVAGSRSCRGAKAERRGSLEATIARIEEGLTVVGIPRQK